LAAWTSERLGKIVPPSREPTMTLAEVIGTPGTQEIEALGTIRFHAVGDTGREKGGNQQVDVAEDMALDYHPAGGGRNPAFFLHLGDVIYGRDKDDAYRDQFYRPYRDYPGKILAIAGNHDGETYSRTDPEPLRAFLTNFCAPAPTVPPLAADVGIFREVVSQPGVYWLLDAPLVHIIGLYSNVAEGPGHLLGAGGDKSQKEWLAKALATIRQQRDAGTRKALLLAVHHPPYSNGGHSGSPAMLAEIDEACHHGGVMPDAVLSGHAHNYQRHTRRVSFDGRPMEIPFVVAGCGGHNDLSVDEAYGQVIGEHTFEKSLRGYGYLLVTVSPRLLTIDMWQVPSASNEPFDTVTVDLSNHRLAER
jgi:predicted phosphodiesterase